MIFENFEIVLILLNFRIFKNGLGQFIQITLPKTSLLVLIDLANKLYHIEKFLISFYVICYEKVPCFIEKICKQTHSIKFN